MSGFSQRAACYSTVVEAAGGKPSLDFINGKFVALSKYTELWNCTAELCISTSVGMFHACALRRCFRERLRRSASSVS